jgi:hypothetical protein
MRQADSVSSVTRIAAEYYNQRKHFHAVCLASSHGVEIHSQLRWKHGGRLRLFFAYDQRSLSEYNTWTNAYGAVQSGKQVEPEPWQFSMYAVVYQ